MNRSGILILLSFFVSGCASRKHSASEKAGSSQQTSRASASGSLIDNNSVWKDDLNNPILAQGGGIIEDKVNSKGDNKFHWFGPEWLDGGTKFVAVRHYTSTDLANWHREDNAFSANENFPSSKWCGRPFVMWNPNTRKYVMVLEKGKVAPDPAVRNTFAFLTANTLYGPWNYQPEKLISGLPAEVGGKSYSLGDLGAYSEGSEACLAYTYDKDGTNHAQGILKLEADFMTPLPPTEANFREFRDQGAREAAGMFKVGNVYYYMTSRCTGWKSSETRFRTASSPTGRWSASQLVLCNPSTVPGAAFSFNTQHDFVLPISGSLKTTYVYFGDRWSNLYKLDDPKANPIDGGNSTGRYAWFPLSFVDTDHNPQTPAIPQINAPNIGTTQTNGNGGDWLINTRTGEWSQP